MQNNTALMILVFTMSAILISNSGCGGANPSQGYFGSIAIPTTGQCGTLNASGDATIVSNNTCYSGVLEDIADSTTEYLWNCLGANGGRSVACNLALPPQSVLPGTSNGLLDDSTYFYVGLDTSTGGIAHAHASTGFSTSCGINKNSLANEDITCLVEIPEGDLYGKNTHLTYNVPVGMCRYLSRTPYWFYNYEVGTAPATIAVSVDNTVGASGDITDTSYACNFDSGGVDVDCDNNNEVTVNLTPVEQTFSCNYDKTSEGGPNCCFGKYTIVTTTTRNTLNPQTVVTKGLWGGDYGDCIGGPGRTNWSAKNKGIPTSLLEFTGLRGVKAEQLIAAPTNLAGGAGISQSTASIHAANYYGGAADHTHTGFVNSADTSVRPYFLEPIDDRSGTAVAAAHDSFEFQCLDAAFEIKHRIRVYIRDWDTLPDYLTYISSAGVIAIPDRGSDPEPGVNCAAIADIGEGCNDNLDSDDFLNIILFGDTTPAPDGPDLLTPLYDTSTPSKRKFYFPRIQYKTN